MARIARILLVRREVPTVKEQLTTYERRENIKTYLIRARETTALRLSYMFGVSIRTIHRDIVFLSSRIPIITKPGKSGGIFLELEFESRKEYLNPNELELLQSLLNELSPRNKLLMMNIINKFSLPKDK